MNRNWTEHRLGDVTTWSSGGTPSKKNEAYWNGDIPWISASSMAGNRYSDSANKITLAGLKAGSKEAKKDSILLLVRGSILHQKIPVGIAEKDVSFNQDVKCLVADETQIEPWFLLFWFMANERKLLNMVESTGIGAGKLDTKQLQNLIIKLPEKAIRKKITSVLKALDDKTILNNQINKTLEEMAQAIFKSWFVDFEPTKAKIKILEAGGTEGEAERAAMTAISGKDSAALDAMADDQPGAYANLQATAKLFPAALTESDLGTIPEGWNVGSFTELAKLDTTSVQPKSNPNQVWDHYSIPAYDAAHYPVQDTGSSIKSGKYRVHELSVLVSKLNPQFKRIWWPKVSNPDTAICSTEFMQFVPLKQEDRGFVHGVISSEPFQENIRQSVTGSTGSRQRAQPPQVASSEIIIPSRDLINIFSSISTSYLTMIAENLEQNQALSNTRDTLLPKLMSGEIDLEGLADD